MSNSDCYFGCDGQGVLWGASEGTYRSRQVCQCMTLRFAQIPKPLHGKHFDNFDASIAPTQFEAVKRWADNFAPNGPSLMLFGHGKGTGKTHLMAAAANAVALAAKVSVGTGGQIAFVMAPDLMAGVTSPESFTDRLEDLKRQVVLFIDDVGQADEGDPAWLRAKKRDAYFRLFNHREMHKLTTVCTSNLESIAQFADVLGEAAADRLLGMCGKPGLVKFSGISSYRLRALLDDETA